MGNSVDWFVGLNCTDSLCWDGVDILDKPDLGSEHANADTGGKARGKRRTDW